MFKPLYKLTLGVLEAMQGMQWVLVFTLIILYASGILFRTVVGHGLLLGDHSFSARVLFSSVPQSMFHLFRLMNGLTPTDSLLSTVSLKLLYMLFLVISNWAVLAILTAVVSDNMIISTQRHEKEESVASHELFRKHSRERLRDVFVQLDTDRNGNLSECEFHALMGNSELCDELCEATQLKTGDLQDLFMFLSYQDPKGLWRIDYTDFIEKLECENKDVSERSVFRVEKQLKLLQVRIERKLDMVRDDLSSSLGEQQDRTVLDEASCLSEDSDSFEPPVMMTRSASC